MSWTMGLGAMYNLVFVTKSYVFMLFKGNIPRIRADTWIHCGEQCPRKVNLDGTQSFRYASKGCTQERRNVRDYVDLL
jgi:hypothetical protein